jgi:hypothetical protein
VELIFGKYLQGNVANRFDIQMYTRHCRAAKYRPMLTSDANLAFRKLRVTGENQHDLGTNKEHCE